MRAVQPAELREFKKGLYKENPLFVLLLGLCPTLAVTTRVVNALGLGAGVILVLLGSNLAVSLLGDFLPGGLKTPAYAFIAASLTTGVDLGMRAVAPALSESLGIYVPLMAVNCLILGRAQVFARGGSPACSLLDALGMGLGFTLGLLLISLFREALGAGTITLFGTLRLPWLSSHPLRVLALASGAFLVTGYLKALFNWLGLPKTRTGKERRRA